MSEIRTRFTAQQHGFRFVNRFEFSHMFSLPFIGSVDLGPIVVGLCGGMCFASLDYFHAGKSIPSQAVVPEMGTALHTYLVGRQIRSLLNHQPGIPPLPAAIWLVQWIVATDSALRSLTVQKELPKLRHRLEKGDPAVLVLVRTKEIEDPTRNHQVVAVGYDLDETPESLVIYLYDPNHPGREPTLHMNAHGEREGGWLTQSTGEPLRGFFIINYRPKSAGLPMA